MDDEEEISAPPDGMLPTLDKFQGVFTDDTSQEWAGHVSTVINDYVQRRSIADRNERAGQTFADNIGAFGQGLVNIVTKDPHAVDMALGLVRPTVGTLVSNVPGHPEELVNQHHDEISSEIEGNVAQAAVRSAANRDAGLARSLLDRVGGILPKGAGDSLGAYIDAQHNARNLNEAVQQQQAERDRSVAESHTALDYLGSLVDPASGDVRFPPNWPQAVLNDPRVGPQASAGLLNTFGRLWQDGDTPSNPYIVHTIAQQLASDTPPSMSSIAEQMGKGLSAADAMSLAAGAAPVSPQAKREYQQLAATLDTAKRILATPENGQAGAAAFERFTKWLMPAYRNNGPGSLNPMADNALIPHGDGQAAAVFWNNFAPHTDDFVEGAQVPGGGELYRSTNDSLQSIFGKHPAPTGDKLISQPRVPGGRVRPMEPGWDFLREPTKYEQDT